MKPPRTRQETLFGFGVLGCGIVQTIVAFLLPTALMTTIFLAPAVLFYLWAIAVWHGGFAGRRYE